VLAGEPIDGGAVALVVFNGIPMSPDPSFPVTSA